MRKLLCGLCLSVVAIGLIGCGATREPHVIIAPSYSYVQADLARGIDGTDTIETTATLPAITKLPPTPAAPGFDTLVFVEDDPD